MKQPPRRVYWEYSTINIQGLIATGHAERLKECLSQELVKVSCGTFNDGLITAHQHRLRVYSGKALTFYNTHLPAVQIDNPASGQQSEVAAQDPPTWMHRFFTSSSARSMWGILDAEAVA